MKKTPPPPRAMNGKINNGLGAVKFRFETITPELAATYLARSKKNRRIKKTTVATYARDMKHGEWITNHQGLAFDEEGTLIDGQHRLTAVVISKCCIRMLVSTGWPIKGNGSRQKAMDTVDRGCVRSLRDTLELQHGITNAAGIVYLATAITYICRGGESRTVKQTPSTTLAIAEIFRDQMRWFCENQSRNQGLRNSSTSGVIVLGLVAWKEKTQKFYEQLTTGLGLTATSPVYHLRNYLLSGISCADYDTKTKIRNATAHHLELFVQGKPSGSLVTGSNAALNRLILAQGDRAKEVCALFDGALVLEETSTPRTRESDKPPDNSKLQSGSAELISLGEQLNGSFTPTDLAARLDGRPGRAGYVLAEWRAKGWVEQAGFGQYRRTAKFGK